MRISRESASNLFFCFVLYLSTGAMEVFTVGSSSSSADTSGSPLMKILWAVVYLVVIAMMLPHRREIARLLVENKALVGLLLLALYSFRWSVDPHETLSKSIPLLLSALVGMEFARRYTTREQLRMLWIVLAVIMVLGVIVQVGFPSLHPGGDPDDEIGAAGWHGLVHAKNTWARLVVLTGIVILSLPRPTRATTIKTAVLMVLTFALLAASRSTGGVVIMAIMTVLIPFFGFLRWKRRKAVVLVGTIVPPAFVLVSFLVVENLKRILVMLNKDPTMTGRTTIWDLSLHAVSKQPWLGYGYAAFWSVDSRPARLIREAKRWDDLPHAHNGYIDMLLGLGAIGLALYATAFFVGMWRGAHYVRRTRGQEAMWPLAFLCVAFLYQINEASIVAGNQLIWILFSSVLFSLGIEEKGYEASESTVGFVHPEPVLVAGD
jgi:O-antigen ligase